MLDAIETKALHSATQLLNAINGEAANANAKLRINSDGLAYFSHKAPGLKSALIGRSAKLTEVKKYLDNISLRFRSNRTDLPLSGIDAQTRGVRSAAAALSEEVTAAIAQNRDITAARCFDLQQAIRTAVDRHAE